MGKVEDGDQTRIHILGQGSGKRVPDLVQIV